MCKDLLHQIRFGGEAHRCGRGPLSSFGAPSEPALQPVYGLNFVMQGGQAHAQTVSIAASKLGEHITWGSLLGNPAQHKIVGSNATTAAIARIGSRISAQRSAAPFLPPPKFQHTLLLTV